MFQDRRQAGEELAKVLEEYKGRADVIVIALPRGGVVLGRIIADALGAPLDIVVPRKIGAPGNEEYAIGAITETGEAVWNEAERARVAGDYAERVVAEEQAEAKRRLDVYRKDMPARDVKGKIVILVDDGAATGYTMRAAIQTMRKEGARKIVAAVPVAPKDTAEELKAEADEVVVLDTPRMFWAIGAHYDTFNQVNDDTVISLFHERESVHSAPPYPA